MDKVKLSADRRSEPNLQKLARALTSIARRQLDEEKAVSETGTTLAAEPNSSKDAA